MSTLPFSLTDAIYLLTGSTVVFLTSKWSPLTERNRSLLTIVAVAAAYLTILPGLAYAKSDRTFLAGSGKAGIFCAWAFGLWLAVQLLRGRSGVKAFAIFSIGIFGLLLTAVLAEELRILRGASF